MGAAAKMWWFRRREFDKSGALTPNTMRKIFPAMLVLLGIAGHLGAAERPLMRDFMGINGHYHFRPDLYRPTCSLVRNYHPMPWDIGKDGSEEPQLPMARQIIDGPGPVDWAKVYGSWKERGFRIDASLQFEFIKPGEWKDRDEALRRYGRAFARTFGPAGHGLVEAAEIGNEPVDYDDAAYRSVFENLARGLREGDPELKIVTAAMMAEGADKYSKNMSSIRGLESLYDVVNIHSYSMIEGWPTWRRVHPEHSGVPYLKVLGDLAAWRNANAPGKEIWLTEFGYDASSQKPPAEGNMAKWVSSTETEQAQWIVRSFLIFSALDLDRAYVYYYNDADKPSFHASSGLTRNFVPKPAYWAMVHLQDTLGDCRFSRIVKEQADVYIYEYVHAERADERVWVLWSPTGEQREKELTIEVPGVPRSLERMPLAEGGVSPTPMDAGASTVKVTVDESPLYLRWRTADDRK